MDKLLDAIENVLTTTYNRLSLVHSSDKFLYREDVQKIMIQDKGIYFVSGDSLSLRIHFETIFKKTSDRYCYLLESNQTVLEDIESVSNIIDFKLKKLFVEYSIEPLLNAELWKLSELYNNKPIITQSKFQTQNRLGGIQKPSNAGFVNCERIESITTIADVKEISENIATVLLDAIKNNSLNDQILNYINNVNEKFQEFLKDNFFSNIVPSSPAVTPKIVSKILPYIALNHLLDDKIALIVIDGMSYWQYLCLLEHLEQQNNIEINSSSIFSWIPSITTLSRQAIFRGDKPLRDYKQSPTNESKLWFNFWEEKGILHSNISYNYDSLDNVHNGITKLAYVIGELDDKMHASGDYADLYALTNTWVKKGFIAEVNKLLSMGFSIIVTTDHGNIQTKAWRYLTQSEKTGTRVIGSRSQRHLEYSDTWSKEQFVINNPDIANHLFIRENSMAISNDWNFSSKGCVSHGGSHILEVVVPFIKIKKTNE